MVSFSGFERKKITFELYSGFGAPGILILALWIFLIYSNTSVSPFVFDDKASILNNPHIRISEIAIPSLLEAGFKGNAPNRPLPNITFALNYFFHQYDVFGYRLVNIAIHFVTAALLYLFLKATFSLLFQSSESCSTCSGLAFISTFLWAVHPLHVQSITYIVQRMNSMAAMFYLLSMLLYVKGRCHRNEGAKAILYIGCLVSGLMSLISKEIAVTLPFFILLYEWYFFQNLSGSWLKRHLKIFVVLGIFLLFLILVYVGKEPIDLILKTYETRDFTLTERLLTESRVVVFYITLILFPHPYRLNLDHDFPVSSSILTPFTTFVAILILVLLFIFAIYSARKNRFLSFSILWFLGNLVLESSIIGLEIIFEHRTYLPSMMLIPMLMLQINRITRQKWTILFGVLLILVFSLWTYQRNIVWQSRITLWQDCLHKSPKSIRSHNNLALALSEQGHFRRAVVHYTAALSMSPDSEIANNGLGLALSASGETDAAIHHFKKALNILPESSTLHYNLGKIYARLNRSEDAISEYYSVLGIDPAHGMAHGNLGFELVRQKQFYAAIYYYMRSIEINPDSFMHNNLGNLLFRMGAIDQALYHYQRALQIKPSGSNLYSSYQIALKVKKHIDEAILLLKEELNITDPSKSILPENATDLKRDVKMLDNAIKNYQTVLKENDIYNHEFFDINNYSKFKQIEDRYNEFRSHLKVELEGL